MMEELFSNIELSIDDVKRRFPGVVTGKVINVLDPMMLGRVQVQLPFVDSVDLSPWARVAVLMAGPLHGSYFLPNVGDEVLVAFEHGDVNAPYVIGSLWNAMAPPPLASPVPQVRTLRTPAGNQITFVEAPPAITISTLAGQTVNLSPAGVQVNAAGAVVSITPAAVTITAPTIALNATQAINLAAPTVAIKAGSAVSITSGTSCSVTAPTVRIN